MDALYVHGGQFNMSLWYFMKSIIDGKVQDECNESQLVVIGASSSVDADNPGLVPYDTDFHGDEIFDGFTNCKYTHSSTGGKIECDGGVTVQCKAATDKPFTCGENARYPDMTMVPSVRCDFSSL